MRKAGEGTMWEKRVQQWHQLQHFGRGVVWLWRKLPDGPVSCTLVHFAKWICCDCSFSGRKQPSRLHLRYNPAPDKEIRVRTDGRSHMRPW